MLPQAQKPGERRQRHISDTVLGAQRNKHVLKKGTLKHTVKCYSEHTINKSKRVAHIQST